MLELKSSSPSFVYLDQSLVHGLLDKRTAIKNLCFKGVFGDKSIPIKAFLFSKFGLVETYQLVRSSVRKAKTQMTETGDLQQLPVCNCRRSAASENPA